MTVLEKRKELDEYCMDQPDCSGCPLKSPVCRCGRGTHFLIEYDGVFEMTDDEIDAAYGIVYPDDNEKAKADAGKLEIDLVPVQIIRDIAEVRMYGNQKYGSPNNWKQVQLRRYINAMLRHTLAFIEDPNGVDEESGIPHYKHAECNWAFISAMMAGRTGTDVLSGT